MSDGFLGYIHKLMFLQVVLILMFSCPQIQWKQTCVQVIYGIIPPQPFIIVNCKKKASQKYGYGTYDLMNGSCVFTIDNSLAKARRLSPRTDTKNHSLRNIYTHKMQKKEKCAWTHFHKLIHDRISVGFCLHKWWTFYVFWPSVIIRV